MPADVKPLFRPDAVRLKLAGFAVPPAAVAARPKLADWVKLFDTPAGRNKKEADRCRLSTPTCLRCSLLADLWSS